MIYRLCDLIVMMIAASLCGATTATEFALFAEQRRSALLQLIDYEEAPSHDTFSRRLSLLDPLRESLRKCDWNDKYLLNTI